MKKKLILAFSVALVALVLAATALGTWNGLNFPRNGTFYATPGTYYDTPEWVNVKQTAGPCSNFRMQLRRVDNGAIIWNQPTANSLCVGQLASWEDSASPLPDYPSGVRIWVVAGPADGQTVGAYFCGGQYPSNAGC